jgi:hypothetical protein
VVFIGVADERAEQVKLLDCCDVLCGKLAEAV